MGIIPSPRFYVYVLCRPNGKPFYVGKGTGRRVFDHDSEARSGHRCHKCNIIRKIWKQGGEVQRYTVFTTDDQDEAYAYEQELIAQYGRENLANGTDGGIGGRGRVVPPEEREIHRQRNKIRNADPAWRAKRSEERKADWARPEYRERQSVQARERWADPERRQRQSTAVRASLAAPEIRARRSELSRAWHSTPEQRAKMGRESQARWDNPEYRARRTRQLTCEACGAVFCAINTTARFCSGRCRQRKRQ